ncbi:MAG: hypothetical protein QOD99_2289 [Chthoniobacter sp.]|jgi:hypothetical protein|nr:hypothetical protein [Chthoniobacter sp.]
MNAHVSSIEILEARIAPATLTVLNLFDFGAGTLRDTIAASAAGDTIKFKAGLTGTLTVSTGDIDIDHKLTIKGPGGNKIILNGNNSSRLFNITDGDFLTDSPVSISGLALIHGKAGVTESGGAIFSYESLTLKNVVISGNTADNAGGVAVFGGDTLGTSVSVINCQVSGNSATDTSYGGGLDLVASKSIVISGSTITGNKAMTKGGGVFARVGSAGTGITISKSLISGNSVTASNSVGGGLAVVDENPDPASKVQIKSSVISGNTATASGGAGGGLYCGAGHIVLTKDSIRANTADYAGGGIEGSTADSLTMTGGSIAGNSVTNGTGGGLQVSGSGHPLTLAGVSIAGNHASGSGGGVNLLGGFAAKLTGVVFSGNTTGSEGGGLYAGNSSSVTISGGTFAGNFSKNSGGGFVILDAASVSMMGTKISGNVSGSDAGGGYLGATGVGASIMVNGVIVAQNEASDSGGGILFGGTAALTLKGGTFTANHAGKDGGGIFLNDTLTGTISATKITGNAANGIGGGIFNDGTAVTLASGEAAKIIGNVALTDPDRHAI